MNILIANQCGRVEWEATRNPLTLSVTAQTPHWDAVKFQTRIDSVEQQLPPLAIRRAVERRVWEFQVRDDKVAQTGEQEAHSTTRSAQLSRGFIQERHPLPVEAERGP